MRRFEFSESAKRTIEKMRSWSVEELVGCRNIAIKHLCENEDDAKNSDVHWQAFLWAAAVEFGKAIQFKLDEEEEKLLRRRG